MKGKSREELKKQCENKREIHVGDQFILTITGVAEFPSGRKMYECNQFTENSFMNREELENMIPVDKDALCYTNGYRTGFMDGYKQAQEKSSKYLVDFICDMYKDNEKQEEE